MYLFRLRKGGAQMHVYVWEHIVIAFTTEPLDGCLRNLVGMKCSLPALGLSVTAISTQGRIKGRGSLLKKTSFSGRKATVTNRMYSNYLEACGMKCCYIWFHSIFLSFLLYSGERQWPLGPLVKGFVWFPVCIC